MFDENTACISHDISSREIRVGPIIQSESSERQQILCNMPVLTLSCIWQIYQDPTVVLILGMKNKIKKNKTICTHFSKRFSDLHLRGHVFLV